MDYYSHGKLLISGEYLVLRGATALAVPVKFGQFLKIEPSDNKNIFWESYIYNNSWFKAELDTDNFNIVQTNINDVAKRLSFILKQAGTLNKNFIGSLKNSKAISQANFDIDWGFGSSSSLISNISYWANIDPFILNGKTSKGSGYDVVCARQNGPVFYKKTENNYSVEKVEFNPEYADQIYFVYLGNKQSSEKSVKVFSSVRKKLLDEIQLISDLSKHIAFSNNINDFKYFVKEHEYIMSSVLKAKMLKEERFKDFSGEVKSLGAWGGDFAMITWEGTKDELVKYLKKKKINTIFQFDELIKTW